VTRGVSEFLGSFRDCLCACLRDCVDCTAEHLRDWYAMRHCARQFCCVDCAVDTAAIGEYYMVWPDVWERAEVAPDDGMLCVGCLEDRIERRLSTLDFMAVPVNFRDRSERLRSRVLGRAA
jgi:hypothetical protein